VDTSPENMPADPQKHVWSGICLIARY